MKVVDIFKQIRCKEERVYLVLMLGRFGKMIDLVCTSFKSDRIVFREMPGSESRLSEGLFRCECVVDDSVRSGQRSVQSGNDVRRIEFTKFGADLVAGFRTTDGDDAVVLEFLCDTRILRINVRRERQNRRGLLVTYKVSTVDDLAGVCIDRGHVKAKGICRELCNLPDKAITIARRVDRQCRLEVGDRSSLLRQYPEAGLKEI